MNNPISHAAALNQEISAMQSRDTRLVRDLPSSLMFNIFEYAGPVSVIIMNDNSSLMRAKLCSLLFRDMTNKNIDGLSQINDDFLSYNPKEGELKLLAAGSNEKARLAVALNVKTPLSLLAKLATDPDERVRLAVALNAKTPLDTLRRLRHDSHIDIQFVSRMAIPLHADATRDPNNELPNKKIRLTIVKNNNSPAVVLDILASDHSRDVRLAIAQHRNTLPRTLAKLSDDSDAEVRSVARLHIQRL